MTSYEKCNHNLTLEVQIICKTSTFLCYRWKYQNAEKKLNLKKNSVKIKSCKTLYETQKASHLKETIQAPPNQGPSDKTLLRLWNKNFLAEIYSNTQTFAFKVHQECGSWASRNDAVQMFFVATNSCKIPAKFPKLEKRLTSKKFRS